MIWQEKQKICRINYNKGKVYDLIIACHSELF